MASSIQCSGSVIISLKIIKFLFFSILNQTCINYDSTGAQNRYLGFEKKISLATKMSSEDPGFIWNGSRSGRQYRRCVGSCVAFRVGSGNFEAPEVLGTDWGSEKHSWLFTNIESSVVDPDSHGSAILIGFVGWKFHVLKC
jgi:hypothetical protein